VPIPENPTLTSRDVTVIIPTIDGEGVEFERTVRSCIENVPEEIILVTIDKNFKRLARWAKSVSSRIRVLSTEKPNKRRQMCRAIPEVRTKITVFADDDVMWSRKTLAWMLAPFEREDTGGVGTSQRLLRSASPNVWGYLAALYLERRNFEISATTAIDGGISCLSGRTVAYKTDVLNDEEFKNGFTDEKWMGIWRLNTDDDNFITRWMVSKKLRTYVQYSKECEVLTTLEDNPKFLKQCLRWARSNWRSNLKSMFEERYIWRYGSSILPITYDR
jgi:cellulose synthase/poly-beta-1,6-N-acetylglucosamine synthase-like glycosyltransferase